ncbi:MAG: hypothetical protein AABW50_04535 [Nanoarchaeota archaeon]
MIESIVCSKWKVTNLKDIKAHVTLELLEETKNTAFQIMLHKSRLNKSVINKLNGNEIEIGSTSLPLGSESKIKYISYDNIVIYPVYTP